MLGGRRSVKICGRSWTLPHENHSFPPRADVRPLWQQSYIPLAFLVGLLMANPHYSVFGSHMESGISVLAGAPPRTLLLQPQPWTGCS